MRPRLLADWSEMIRASIKTNFVSTDELLRRLQPQMREAMKQVARDRVAGMRCDVHGESPILQFAESGDGVEATIRGCCQEFVDKTQRALTG